VEFFLLVLVFVIISVLNQEARDAVSFLTLFVDVLYAEWQVRVHKNNLFLLAILVFPFDDLWKLNFSDIDAKDVLNLMITQDLENAITWFKMVHEIHLLLSQLPFFAGFFFARFCKNEEM